MKAWEDDEVGREEIVREGDRRGSENTQRALRKSGTRAWFLTYNCICSTFSNNLFM